MADIYNKTVMNKLYRNANIISKKKCKPANENTIDFQRCYLKAMANNARNIAVKLRGQIDSACATEKDKEKCAQKMQDVIYYFVQKQEEYEDAVVQLSNFEESFLNTGRKLICQKIKNINCDQTDIDYVMNKSPKSEIINMLFEICEDSNLNKNHKQIIIEGLNFIKG